MSEEKQVLVTFVTKLPQELQVPQTEVVGAAGRLLLLLPLFQAGASAWKLLTRYLSCLQAVPASLKRYGLSQIINHLLALGTQQGWSFQQPTARYTALWLLHTCQKSSRH